MPNAGSISIKETLALFDFGFAGVSKGVAQGEYAFWLGSGISRDQIVGLDGVISKLIEFLRIRVTSSPECKFRLAFDSIMEMAAPSQAERDEIDLGKPASTWPCLKDIVKRLWNQYSAVLSVEIPGEKLDFLLWDGLDFRNTFSAQTADAEHLAVAMLALEGVVTEIATANWDGLIEAAMKELGYDENFYRVTVTGEDLRNPAAAANLYKFHGCALRAIADESNYRPLLVARTAQITSWKTSDTFKVVRDQLGALVQRSRTLMIGMSAQDENIKHLFVSTNTHKGWKWTDSPCPIVFSAQELGNHQKSVLIGSYGEADYEAYRDQICDAARLPAYAKPLLLALLLHVITAKLETLACEVEAPYLDASARDEVAEGIRALRDKVADAGNADRLALARGIASGLARAKHQLQNGASVPGAQPYFPLDNEPVHRMKNKLALKSTGQHEAALMLGIIGLEDKAATWTVSIDDPTSERSGALRLTSSNATARVFFAANDDTIVNLLDGEAFDEDDADAVILCSKRVVERQQRSPSGAMRSGVLGARYVGLGPLINEASNLGDLRDRLRGEIGL